MAAKSKSTEFGELPKSTAFSAPMDFGDITEINYTAMTAAGEIGKRWTEAMGEINGELLQFASRRLKEDMVIPAGLAKCKTGEEIFEFYSNFFRTAVNQYAEEAETLAHIGADFVGSATKVVEAESRDVHDIAAE
mgnify:CR=1 FL=1